MYLNAYQRYIAELLDEYGALLVRQLLVMVNNHFKTDKRKIDGYAEQMCRFGDYVLDTKTEETILSRKGIEPDFDVIRSVEVMIAFLPKVIFHCRGSDGAAVSFFVQDAQRDKEISVIPVHYGMEWQMSQFVAEKYSEDRNMVVVFLMDDKKQIKKMQVGSSHKLALIDKKGISFFKR